MPPAITPNQSIITSDMQGLVWGEPELMHVCDVYIYMDIIIQQWREDYASAIYLSLFLYLCG